jgi:hypothetical protein
MLAGMAHRTAPPGRVSLYKSDDNFLFPSLRMNGTQPLMPDMVLRKIIRPALERAGVTGKTVGRLALVPAQLGDQSPQPGSRCQGCTGATQAREFAHHDGPLYAHCFRRQAQRESEAG